MFVAVLIHILTRLTLILLAIPTFRWLLSKIIPAPGTGPDSKTADKEKQTFVAVGRPSDSRGREVRVRFAYEGSLYWCSAMMGVEAAVVVLGGEGEEGEGRWGVDPCGFGNGVCGEVEGGGCGD